MKLIRSALTTACLLATAWAVAAPSPVRMDGETLPQEFVGQMTKSERLKEYVAADETFERWTRLIGLRLQSAPQINNDPMKMAQNMAALAQRQYPDMPPPNIRPQKDGACKPPPPFASNDTTFYKLTLFPRQNLLHLSACKHITCRLLFWLNLCLKSQLSQTSKAYCLHMQSDNSAAP